MNALPRIKTCWRGWWVVVLSVWVGSMPQIGHAENARWHHQTVSFLGTSLDRDHQPIGVVAKLNIAFRKRGNPDLLNISFASGPGKFSPLTQVAIQEGIKRAALAAGLDTRAWDIFLTFPVPGVTVYGESVSAMVSVAVLAMANEVPLLLNRVATGKITKDGEIGAVGGIPLKIQAAYAEHIHRVIIPEERFQEDSDWQTPFLMHISPVKNLRQAYRMLTGRTLSEKRDVLRSTELHVQEK
jgi:predicted S18 family serine protease